MRSEKINSIYSPIITLPGIGSKIESLLNRIGIYRTLHFLWHIPYNVIKRQKHLNIHEAEINSVVTLKIKILKHNPSRFKRQPYRVSCLANKTAIDIVYFNARHPIIRSILPSKSFKMISGKLEFTKPLSFLNDSISNSAVFIINEL